MSIEKALQCWYLLENAEVAVKTKERYEIGIRRKKKHMHRTQTQVAAAAAALAPTNTHRPTCIYRAESLNIC